MLGDDPAAVADALALADLQRRVRALVELGVVEQLDPVAARARVRVGELLTGWLPWLAARAGNDRTWWAPEPGEQVALVARAGDLRQGVILGSLYRTAHPAPGDRPTLARTAFADGAVVEYDREAHAWLLDVPAGGTITLRIGQTSLVLRDDGVTLTAPDIAIDQP